MAPAIPPTLIAPRVEVVAVLGTWMRYSEEADDNACYQFGMTLEC
jgi:hypothetical protein